MTNREFLNAIIDNKVTDKEIAAAKAILAKLDERNEKRRNTLSKSQKENVGVKTAIKAFLATNPNAFASVIGAGCGISTQKASALCRQMVESGEMTVKEVKVKGKGALKAYALAVVEDNEEKAE